MRVLVVCGRVPVQVWSRMNTARRIIRGLAERGHEVEVLARSVDDLEDMQSHAQVRAMVPFSQTTTAWPFGFAHWARAEARKTPHDVSLSFSATVGGDVWMPLEPSGRAWADERVKAGSLTSLPIILLRHWGFVRAWGSAAMWGVPASVGEPISRVIAVGNVSGGEAVRGLHRLQRLEENVVVCEAYAPVLDTLPTNSDIQAERQRVRQLVNIRDDRCTILIVACEGIGKRLDNLLRASAKLHREQGEASPILLCLAKDELALHDRARKLGAAACVRIIGLTDILWSAMAAVDAVCLAIRSSRTLFEAGACGRLGADTLAMGKPLVALSGASGYELARRGNAGSTSGLVVDNNNESSWLAALEHVSDTEWRAEASRQAAIAGQELRFAKMLDTVERTLASVGSLGLDE